MKSRSYHKAEMIPPCGIVPHYLETTLESAIPDSPRKIATDKQGKDWLFGVAVQSPGFQAQLRVYQVPRVWSGGNATRKVKDCN